MTDARSLASIVRKADYDRYLAALFARAGARPHLIALYAFNYEVAKTAESVSQPVVGQIRLQWWRDAVEEIYAGKVREHEVVQALAGAVAAHALPRRLFEALIEARENDLDEQPFADMASLEAYCDATSGNLMRLALRILGAGGAFDVAAGEAGIAYAMTGLLRALPFHAARQRFMLPLDRARAAQISLEDIFAGRTSAGLSALIADMEALARKHLDAARAQAIPRGFLPALLPASLVPSYLRTIARPGFDPFREPADAPLHSKQRAMLGTAIKGWI